jgi:hypothetical protein
MESAAIDAELQSHILRSTLKEVASRTRGDTDDGGLAEEAACCVICLDVITEPCEANPCKHSNFDYLCLHEWLGRGKGVDTRPGRCPLCKAIVEVVKHDLQDGNFRQEQAYPKLALPRAVASSLPSAYPQQTYRPIPPRQRRPSPPPRRRVPTEDEAISRRRQIYRDQLYSLHVGTNRASQYTELTPDIFQRDDHLVSRARTWLRRELKVFAFLHTPTEPQSSTDAVTRRRANNAEFLLEYIVAILKTVDTQGSQGQAEDMLQEFLGRENTRLLLHELRNFLRSPGSLEAWDRSVQYPEKRKRRSGGTGDEPPTLAPALRRNAQGRPRGDLYRPRYRTSSSQGRTE